MGFIRALRMFLSVLGCVVSLPVLYAGGELVWGWFQMRGGQVFYVGSDFDILGRGLEFVLVGGAGLGLCAYATIRRQVRPGVLFGGCFCAFGFGTVVLLGAHMYPLKLAEMNATSMVSDVDNRLFDWARERGHYPANEADFREALARLDLESPFKRAGAAVQYRLVYVGGSSGPLLTEPPPQEPGTVFCAFRSDLHECWITVTTLEKPVRGPVVWLKLLGKPYVHRAHLPDQWYRPPK